MRRVQLKSLMCATCYVCVRVLEMITCNVHNSLKAFSQILFLTLSDNVVADTCFLYLGPFFCLFNQTFCRTVKSLCRAIKSLCRTVKSLCRTFKSLCRFVKSLCRTVNSLCRTFKSLCRTAISVCITAMSLCCSCNITPNIIWMEFNALYVFYGPISLAPLENSKCSIKMILYHLS